MKFRTSTDTAKTSRLIRTFKSAKSQDELKKAMLDLLIDIDKRLSNIEKFIG